MFYKDHEALPPKAQLVNDEMHSEDRLVSPVIDRTSDFPTAQAHLHHIKLNKLFFEYVCLLFLLRLCYYVLVVQILEVLFLFFHFFFLTLFSYYGIDRTSEEGMAIIDQIVHTYDISPGKSHEPSIDFFFKRTCLVN